MITDRKVEGINAAMAEARRLFNETLQQAEQDLAAALAQHTPAGDATANWNLVEAHNRYRNTIEGAAFQLRLAFLKCAGRRE